MADALPADSPAASTPDIDTMSDEQFTEFKKTLTDEAPASEPAPAPADDDDDDEGDASAPQGTVPHAKFHRANERRKESERRAQEAERASTLAMQRMAELLEASKPREPEPQPQAQEFDLGPDPDIDPIGALAWNREQKRIELEQRRQWEQQTAQQQQAQRQWQEAYVTTVTQFETAKSAEPQLQGLYDGLRESYAREYQAYGYPMAQIGQLVERQEAQIIQWAHANRVPIAQAIKNLAASRGVQAQAPAAASTPERDPVTGQFKSAAELDRIEKAKQAAKSLGGGGAAVRADVPTAQDIVNMSDEDFAAFKKKHGEKAMRIAMGGA